MERKRLIRVLIMTGAFLLPSFVGMLLVCLWNGGRGVPLPRFLQLFCGTIWCWGNILCRWRSFSTFSGNRRRNSLYPIWIIDIVMYEHF